MSRTTETAQDRHRWHAAVDVGMLLGAAYVAFDDVETALATYKHVIERKAKFELDARALLPI